MSDLDLVKSKIKKLYEANPLVYVDVTISRQKLDIQKATAKIVGVYPNLFRLEDSITKEKYTVQYTELLMGHIAIYEQSTDA